MAFGLVTSDAACRASKDCENEGRCSADAEEMTCIATSQADCDASDDCLNVDEETGLVRREDGTRVPGLYAAGRAAVGICSNSYVSGLSLADCVFSGRRAGRHAAKPDPED